MKQIEPNKELNQNNVLTAEDIRYLIKKGIIDFFIYDKVHKLQKQLDEINRKINILTTSTQLKQPERLTISFSPNEKIHEMLVRKILGITKKELRLLVKRKELPEPDGWNQYPVSAIITYIQKLNK